MSVDTTTYLADAKMMYGSIEDQVSTLPAFWNLLENGPMDSPISAIGIRGYTFLARLQPNWRLGFRLEGTTGVGSAGNQGLAQATVSLKYAYVPLIITGQAENLTKGNEKAFMQAKALEAKYDMKDIVSHINMIMVGAERGGQLAQVASAGAGSIVATAYNVAPRLPGAGYLRVGMPIDAGPVGGGTLTVTNRTITAINYTTRTITHATDTATAGDAVTLSGEFPASSADFPMTVEGLVSLVAATGSRQGLNPATTNQEAWQSWAQDVGGVDISSQIIHEQIAFTMTRSGEDPDLGIYPTAQINKLVSIATQTLRFDVPNGSAMEKKALDLGFTTYSYGGRTIVQDKDARQDRTYWGKGEKMRKFQAIGLSLADDEAGTFTRVTGASGVADATSGLLRTYLQLGILQRSAWSVYTNFTVPAAFQESAPTL